MLCQSVLDKGAEPTWTRFSVRPLGLEENLKTKCQKTGTELKKLMSCLSTTSERFRASERPSGGMTIVPPDMSGVRIFPMSPCPKCVGRVTNALERASLPIVSELSATRARIARKLSKTPFGDPVVPDVKRRSAGSSISLSELSGLWEVSDVSVRSIVHVF